MLDSENVDDIKKASEELSKAVYNITARLYSQTNPNQGAQGQGGGNQGGENINGDYKVE